MTGISLKTSILGGITALILSLSCCWLPALIIALGGATSMVSFSAKLDGYSGILMTIGAILLGYGVYRLYQTRNSKFEAILESTIKCPKCGHQEMETMPTDACQYFYECKNCKEVLKPLEGDCCVFCSYGTVTCPPIQEGLNCCD